MSRRSSYCMVGLDGGWLRVRFGGLEADDFAIALDDLKDRIPASARDWDPEARCWLVDARHAGAVRTWAEAWFDEIDWPAEPPVNDEIDAWVVLWLRAGAPRELVRAAYRALARIHHPDVGGDPDAMTAINAAYAELTRDEVKSA